MEHTFKRLKKWKTETLLGMISCIIKMVDRNIPLGIFTFPQAPKKILGETKWKDTHTEIMYEFAPIRVPPSASH